MSQYLGHWGKGGIIIVPYNKISEMANAHITPIGSFESFSVLTTSDLREIAQLYHPVWNSSYRDWQRIHQRGGDFVIFSDYVVRPLRNPIEVQF